MASRNNRYERLLKFYQRLYRISSSVQRRFSKAGHTLLLFILLTAVFGIDTRQTQIYQVFSLSMAFLLSALLFSLFQRRKLSLQLQRQLPHYASVDEHFEYRITIHNHTNKEQQSLVLYEIIDHRYPNSQEFIKANPPGEKRRNWFDRRMGYPKWLWLVAKVRGFEIVEHPLATLNPGVNHINLSFVPFRRGRMIFRGMHIGCPDPLGLFRSFQFYECTSTVLILPKIYKVPPLQLAGPRMYQQGGMSLASSVGDSEEFYALRDYQAGDPIRFIHWRSWAKRGEPVVKKYQDEYFQRHALILDNYCDSEVYIPYNEAVNVAASFTYAQHNQDSLLDLMFVGEQAYCFTAGRGQSSAEGLLEILANVIVRSDGDFQELSNLVFTNISRLSAVLCVFCHWDEKREELVNTIVSLGIDVRVVIISYQASSLICDYENKDIVHWISPHEVAEQIETLGLQDD